MKKLLAAALALVLVLLAVEVGTASVHDLSWQIVAAVATAPIPAFGGAFTIASSARRTAFPLLSTTS